MNGKEQAAEPVTIRSAEDFRRALDLRSGLVVTIRNSTTRKGREGKHSQQDISDPASGDAYRASP